MKPKKNIFRHNVLRLPRKSKFFLNTANYFPKFVYQKHFVCTNNHPFFRSNKLRLAAAIIILIGGDEKRTQTSIHRRDSKPRPCQPRPQGPRC